MNRLDNQFRSAAKSAMRFDWGEFERLSDCRLRVLAAQPRPTFVLISWNRYGAVGLTADGRVYDTREMLELEMSL